MEKNFRLFAGIMSMILAAGSIAMPVQAGIFDKIKQTVDEATEDTKADVQEDVHEIDFLHDEMSDFVTGDNGVQVDWTFSRLYIDDDEHNELNAALKKYSDLNMELVQDAALEIAEEFDGKPNENTHLYYSILANPMRTDSRVLSFWEDEYSFDGYDYNNAYTGYNFDPKTGKALRLEDIVQDHIDLKRDLPQIFAMTIEENYDAGDFDQDIIDDDLTAYLSETYDDWYPHLEWALGYEGITFLLPTDTLSMYGNIFMFTPYFDDFADFVKPDYTKISVESLNMLHENYMNLAAQEYWVYPEEEGASLYAEAKMELLRSDYSYELSTALFSSMEQDYETYSDEFLSLVEENRNKLGKNGWEIKYTVKDRHRRADNKVLSFVRSKNVFSTSDGYFIYKNRGYNFDPVTGRELRLGNIVEDKDIFADAFKTGIRTALENGFGDEEYAEGMNNLAGDIKDGTLDACTDEFSWSLGYEGIVFYMDGSLLLGDNYPPMQITAYVPFKGNEKAFDKKYLSVPETYTVKILSFKDQDHAAGYEYMDIDGDGLAEEIFFDVGEYAKAGKYTAHVAYRPWSSDAETLYAEKELITDEDIQELNAYLVRTEEGGTFLFLSFYFQDDYSTYVFELTKDGVQYTGSSFEGLIEYSADGIYKIIFGNPKDFTTHSYYPVLGTHYAWKRASLNQTYAYPDEPLYGDDNYLYFDSYNAEMTLKRRISGSYVDFTGDPYGSAYLKVGDRLQLYRTDEASFLEFFTEEGKIFRIDITVGPDLYYEYNGRDLETYFDNISYAVG